MINVSRRPKIGGRVAMVSTAWSAKTELPLPSQQIVLETATDAVTASLPPTGALSSPICGRGSSSSDEPDIIIRLGCLVARCAMCA